MCLESIILKKIIDRQIEDSDILERLDMKEYGIVLSVIANIMLQIDNPTNDIQQQEAHALILKLNQVCRESLFVKNIYANYKKKTHEQHIMTKN